MLDRVLAKMIDRYDRVYFERRDREIDRREWIEILERIPRDVKIVLEIGSGTCGLAGFLREHGFQVVGLDISSYAVNICRSRGFEVVQADARFIPFRDGSFDAVVSQHVIEHCLDPKKCVDESARVARIRAVHVVPGHPVDDPTHVVNYFEDRDLVALVRNYYAVIAPEGAPRDWVVVIYR